MAVSSIKVSFSCDVKKVWDTVTSLEEYSWRSDLNRIEVIGNDQFIEYTKGGYPTTFTVTVSEPYQRWEFDMDNGNMKGHWTGIFTQADGKTVLKCTETVIPKKVFMKPFVSMYLKKQQALYIADLKKVLEEEKR